jgi:hypothetical protein
VSPSQPKIVVRGPAAHQTFASEITQQRQQVDSGTAGVVNYLEVAFAFWRAGGLGFAIKKPVLLRIGHAVAVQGGYRVVSLLRNCIELQDAEAWCDLWMLFEEAAGTAVRRLAWRCGVGRAEADELVKEIFASLVSDDLRKLRSCRAENEHELRGWLAQVASNATFNWLDKRRRFIHHEQAALAAFRPADRCGLDEQQLAARFEELKQVIPAADFEKLQILAGLVVPTRTVPQRTLRYWTRDLLQRYGNHF